MFSAWQQVVDNHAPSPVFERNNCMVVTRSVEELEDGQWKWEEYAMPKDVYTHIIAGTTPLEALTEQNTADIDYIAAMADIEL